MTPKEKAKDLYIKFDNLLNKDFIHPIIYDNQLKQCALIAVDEVLGYMGSDRGYQFWKEVKQEIEKL
jgi:hypothetical protein